MYIKFDEHEKLYAYTYAKDAPDQEYVYCEMEFGPRELAYVVRRNGIISLDQAAMQRDAEKTHIDMQIRTLKSELEKIKEDLEQETFGLLRNDYAAKKQRAAEIVNELRVLEGKAPRDTVGTDKEVI